MHDALRMYHHLDHFCGRIEQPVRFDDFEPLVHHGRRINGDFPAHHPVRVRASLNRGDVVELADRPRAERPAGCGKNDSSYADISQTIAKIARQRLKDRVMFTIDWQQRRAILHYRIHENSSRHYQRFLVGKQHRFACPCSSERRWQAGGSDDGGHDDIGTSMRSDVGKCTLTSQYFRVTGRPLQARAQRIGTTLVCNHGIARMEFFTLQCEFFDT